MGSLGQKPIVETSKEASKDCTLVQVLMTAPTVEPSPSPSPNAWIANHAVKVISIESSGAQALKRIFG